jgi:hypothetical protein
MWRYVMYNVCIFGHKPGDLHRTLEEVGPFIDDVVRTLQFQYGKQLCLNVDGEIGVGQIVTRVARPLSVRYHIFLPCPVELLGKNWFDEQTKQLQLDFGLSSSTTLISDRLSEASLSERDHRMIDHCNFAICFWERNRAAHSI